MGKINLKQELKNKKLEYIKVKEQYLKGIRDDLLKPKLDKNLYREVFTDNNITRWKKREVIKKSHNPEYIELIQKNFLEKRTKVKKF